MGLAFKGKHKKNSYKLLAFCLANIVIILNFVAESNIVMYMKHLVFLSLWTCMTLAGMAQNIDEMVQNQLSKYPQSRLLDVYKSCFQDFMGAEHLVGDTASVSRYLDYELQQIEGVSLMDWYAEPCGINGQYVRVSLRAVQEGLVTKEKLLSVFIRSANYAGRPSVEAWKTQWEEMIQKIDSMQLNLPYYNEDRQFIADVLAQGKYAISHSPDYREAYRPHYRIVRREIFEQEIKPLLPSL